MEKRMEYNFRKAKIEELPRIWEILQQAIIRRKEEGSNQWQDGYPNPEVIKNDIGNEVGFVLTTDDQIIGYTAVLINDEPEYANIHGKWMSNEDFVVFHRVAVSKDHLGKGLAQKIFKFIEKFALENHVYSIKADTNFDNMPMLRIFEKTGYKYCGEVYFRGSPRKAYEKILKN